MNQAIETALKFNRKICFVGRSFIKARDIGKQLGYMKYPANMEIKPQQVMSMEASKVMILIPGSQAQEGSGLVRVAGDDNRDIKISKDDTVIFSSDPIPGNEVNIYTLIDTLSKKGVRVIHSEMSNKFHVSGHGYQNDIKLLATLTKPRFTLPIGGNFRHMVAYKELMKDMGYSEKEIILPENGQEIVFSKSGFRFGSKIPLSTVYVDEITGEEMEKFVLMDRKKISNEGIIIVMAEVEGETGKIVSEPDVIARGFVFSEKDDFTKRLEAELKKVFSEKTNQATHFGFYRKMIQRKTEELLYKMKREPLVIPVVIEV
jgi:ribonuclease J